MLKHIISIMVVLLSLLSCGENKNGTAGDATSSTETSKEDNLKKSSGEGGNKCLLTYQTKMDELLTPEMAVAITSLPINEMETKYSKVLKNPEHHSLIYKWENKRIGKVLSHTGELENFEVSDVVGIESIKAISVAEFKAQYKAPTAEEIEKTETIVEESLDEKTQKKVAKKMTGLFATIAKENRDVEGIGDAASWNEITSSLNVIQDGVKIEIRVNITNDAGKNKEMAVALANQLLNKCK